ncbi:tumor protein p73 isoform X1 [Tachysurus ichikawai]
MPGRPRPAKLGTLILNLHTQPETCWDLDMRSSTGSLGGNCFQMKSLVIYPTVEHPMSKMSQSSTSDEGTTFEHLWSSLEPDSTYFELPQTSHPERGASSAMPNNRAEVCMDVYQMRDLNDNVMVAFPSTSVQIPSLLPAFPLFRYVFPLHSRPGYGLGFKVGGQNSLIRGKTKPRK